MARFEYACRRVLGLGVCCWTGVGAGAFLAVFASNVQALGPADVLLLVNSASPVSRSVAGLYRRYYPDITDQQVLYLSGLPDSASPTAGSAQEIITRDQYNTLIAQPLRNYLVSQGMVSSVYCFITTAGMPYRIKDSAADLANVVYAAGSNPMLTVNNLTRVDAASVESELSVLFQTDPALPAARRLSLRNRLVNPYQGYRAPIKSWSGERDILARRQQLRWTFMWQVALTPWIEGEYDDDGFSARNRIMSPADIYLVARLDGPRRQGASPFFAVRRMLERAVRVGARTYAGFKGYNAGRSFIVIDGSPSCASGCAYQYAYTPTYNLRPGNGPLDYETNSIPPGVDGGSSGLYESNHFDDAFRWLTWLTPPANTMVSATGEAGLGATVLWDDTGRIVNQSHSPVGADSLMGLLSYGRNGGDGRPAGYLLTSGPGGGPLFTCAPGAVFSSLESFNAVTMFTSSSTSQAKICDFIGIGGSGAVGHAFEPEGSALIQGDFMLANYLRDDDDDSVGDLTWVEAAYTGLPFLSWSEVVIGDPLMRVACGPGGIAGGEFFSPDINGDGAVDGCDYGLFAASFASYFGDYEYDPLSDFNEDGRVDGSDYGLFAGAFGVDPVYGQ